MATERDLLRRPRRRTRRHRRRDQARLPQARPAVAPRRQHGSRGARSASRRSTRPTRSCPTRSAASATTCSGGPGSTAGRGRRRASRGSAASATSSTRSSAARPAGATRRGRPQAGSDLRYDLRITFEEAINGTEKEIEFRVLGRVRDVRRQRRQGRDVGRSTCPQCNGRGEVRSVRQTMLGQMVNVTTCPRCRGEGKIVEAPCETCHGDGRTERKRDAARDDPGGHRRGPPDPPLQRGRGRAARRAARAACTSRSTSRRTRRLKRDGTELYYEADVSIAQAALGTTLITCRRSTATRRSRSSPARSPAPRSGCAARACPHLRRTGSRGDLHVLVDVAVPTKLSKKQRELLEAYAERVGRVGRERSGGIRRQARARLTSKARRPAAWLELSVEADLEAVEAVSEILGRVAPGGTSVEPAFELVDEGLGARVDPTRPAIVRGVRAGAATRPRPRRAVAEVSGGARPPPGVRPAADRRAADAARPRGRLGGRVEGALPGAAGRPAARHPADLATPPTRSRTTSSSRSTRGWRSGPGCTRRPGCASRRSSRWPTTAASPGARVLDVGLRLRDPRDRGRAARRARRALGVDTDPIAIEATTANARRNRLARRIRAREGSLPSGEPPFDVVLANLIAGVLVPLAPALRAELRPGGTLLASGIFVDREAEVARRVRGAPGLESTGRSAEGRLGRARGAAPADPMEPGARRRDCPPTIARRCPPNLVPVLLVAHIDARDLRCSCRRSCCRSRCAPAARRSTPTAGSSASCCGRRRTGRSSSGSGWRSPGWRSSASSGQRCSSSRGCSSRSTIYFVEPGHRVLHPAPEPAPRSSASRRPPTTRSGRSGRKRQRYVSYLMAGLVGTIGFLMSTKPRSGERGGAR